VLVIGDRFGAISCALHEFAPVVCVESAAGCEARRANLERNGREFIAAASVLDMGEYSSRGELFDVVLIKVPKSTAAFEDLLYRIRPVLGPNATVLCAGMDKHLPGSTSSTLEQIIGPTTRSRATKRARHFVTTPDTEVDPGSNPWPKEWRAHGLTLMNNGGSFSPNKLDPGTALLLDSVPDFISIVETQRSSTLRIVDLGCGNGVIGLRAGRDASENDVSIEVIAIDDSALAVDATEGSWRRTERAGSVRLSTHHAHRMAAVVDEKSVDLVIVNPPFHDDHVVGDGIAWSMFVDAHRVLAPGGALIVVGNRHMAYHAKLKKIFGAVEVVASNRKFVVYLARRT